MIAASDAFAPATLVACGVGVALLPLWWRFVGRHPGDAPAPPARRVDAVWPVPGGLLLFVVYGLLAGAVLIGVKESLPMLARLALAAAILVGLAVASVGLPRLIQAQVGVGRAIAYGALTFLAALPVVYGIAYLESLFVGKLPAQDMVERIARDEDGMRELVFMTVAVAPFVEELIFRGLFFGGLSRTRGPRYALVFSSFVFGVVHYQPWVAILPMVAFGFFLGLLMRRTGSLVACFVAHALFNLLSVVVLVTS